MTDTTKSFNSTKTEPRTNLVGESFGTSSTPLQNVANISFENTKDMDKIIRFLDAAKAVVLAPKTSPNKGNPNLFYAFFADLNLIESGINTTDIVGLSIFEYGSPAANSVNKLAISANKNNLATLNKFGTTRDKINFLYHLYYSIDMYYKDLNPITIEIEKYIKYLASCKIFKNFMLHKLKLIEAESNPERQNQMILDVAQSFAFTDGFLQKQTTVFLEVLGHATKNKDNPLYMKILLKNGIYTNLFDLDLTEHYQIMHSVDVSKLIQGYDFSNIDINGDFICKNSKQVPFVFPQRINGLFDCTGYKFDIDRIPDGATVVDLSNTKKNFATLNKIYFPASVFELKIDSGVFKNILSLTLNSADGDAELSAYDEFVANHPNIQIMNSGGSLNLSKEIAKTKSEKQAKEQAQQQRARVQAKSPKDELPLYSETDPDWFLRSRFIIDIESRVKFKGLKFRVLEKLVKKVLEENKATICQQTMRLDGNIVHCIHSDHISHATNLILASVNELPDKQPDKKPTPKPESKNVVIQKEPEVEVKPEPKKPEPVSIKKYVSKQVLSDIQTLCGTSKQLYINVLERIAMINIDYTNLPNNVPVQYLDNNGNLQTINNMKHKRNNAAALAIENNDARRIVLSLNLKDGLLVVTACFRDHDDKDHHPYNAALAQASKCLLPDERTKVDADLVKSGDYIDIDDKLNELTPKTPEQPVAATEQKTTADETDLENKDESQKKKRAHIKQEPFIRSSDDSNSLMEVIALETKVESIIKMLEAGMNELKEKKAPNSVIKRLQDKIMGLCRS